MNEKFDTIIVVVPNDFLRLRSNYKRLLKYLPSEHLYFVGNEEVGRLVEETDFGDARDRVGFINENDIIPFDKVNAVMQKHMEGILGGENVPRGYTGWYYQQFLKMEYYKYSNNEYYMSWDGDTVPTKEFSMFKEDGSPFLDMKHELNEYYFETMSVLIPGLKKFVEPSFISEHMLFKASIMKQMIEKIEGNDKLLGDTYYEKIIRCIEPGKINLGAFSEFETYGSFLCLTAPYIYRLREWHSFRLAGEFYDPETIDEEDYKWLSRDFDAISFEKGMSVREDHKNLFDNKEYQSKLSARQMLEIAQEEFDDGYTEVWK